MTRWVVLLSIWVVAFLLRGAYLWQIADAPFVDLRIGDAAAYHAWARRIADGDWLGRDVFYQAPLYPYFLAVIYRLLGDSVTVVRLVQACLGATSCACLAAAGMSLFGPRGAIAGLALAVYPPAIFFDGLLEKSSLVTFFTTALLALLASPAAPTVGGSIATGVVLGLLALTRENALLLAVPVLLWMALSAPTRQRRLIAPLAVIGGCVLVLMPVALRNFSIAGEFHLTTSQFGPNFYIGNHAGASGMYEPLVVGRGNASVEREDATRLAEQGSGGQRLTPGEVSRYWTARAIADIRSQPRGWLRLMARKLGLTFNASDVADTESQDVFAEWSSLLRVLGPIDFGILLGAAAFGAALTARDWRRLWFLYAILATYVFSVVLFYVFARYRFPMVPVLMLLAAGGVAALFRREATGGEARSRSRFAIAGAMAVMTIVCAHWPLDFARGARVIHYHGIATELAKDPARESEAMAFYDRALEAVPNFPAAQFGLATLLTRAGRPAEALPYFRAAVQSWPGHAEGHYNFGVALAQTGQWHEASQHYEDVLRLQPDDPDAHLALAKALLAQEHPALAVPHYERSLALRPNDPAALVGLGVSMSQLRRYDRAIELYRSALAIDPNNASAENSLGWTLATISRMDEAIPHFERALALNPNDENARRNLERVRELQATGK